MEHREAIKEQIRQAVNIVDVIAEQIALRPAGKDFKGLCPFHRDKRPSLTVSPAKQIFKCFACGAGGDVFAFVQRRENVSFPEAIAILADRAGIRWEPSTRGASETGIDRATIGKVNGWACEYFRSRLLDTDVGASARAYLERRGLSAEMQEAFRVGLAVDSYEALMQAGRGKGFGEKVLLAAGLVKTKDGSHHYDTFRNRLMFPIVDATSRVIGFGGRTLGDDSAKYLNTPETLLFDKGRQVYGLHLARQQLGERGRAIVVEGYTDCMMAHQFGFSETVATLGTAMTDTHGQLLRRYTEEVVLLFDSDEAGRRAAERALMAALGGRLSVRVACMPDGQDPCDYLLSAGAEAFAKVIDSAVDAFEFKWRQVYDAHQAGESSGAKRTAIESFLDAILTANQSGTVDVIDQGLLLNRLSPLLGLPTDTLHRLLARRRGTQRQQRAVKSMVQPTDDQAKKPAVVDAEQAALREILEVLISEPGMFGEAENRFRPERFADRDLALIGQAVCGLAKRLGEFSVVELIGEFEDPQLSDLITDLQYAGEQRGRYRERLLAATETLSRVEQGRAASEAGQSVLEGDSENIDREAVDEALRKLQSGARDQHHFVPRSVQQQYK